MRDHRGRPNPVKGPPLPHGDHGSSLLLTKQTNLVMLYLWHGGTDVVMIRLIAAQLSPPMRATVRDLRASFEVSSFAYLLRNAPNIVPTSQPQPVLAD